jgi:hypothetical protein
MGVIAGDISQAKTLIASKVSLPETAWAVAEREP